MKNWARRAVTIATLLSFGTAHAATPGTCVTREEMHGIVGYALPTAYASVRQACSGRLAKSSYLASRGDEMELQLLAGRDAAWPGAKSAFAKLGGTKSDIDLAKLPDSAVRPMVDALFGQKLVEEIGKRMNSDDCADASNIMERAAPLGAANLVELITEVAMVVLRKDKKMPTCSAKTAG